jgi:hypothetical protein
MVRPLKTASSATKSPNEPAVGHGPGEGGFRGPDVGGRGSQLGLGRQGRGEQVGCEQRKGAGDQGGAHGIGSVAVQVRRFSTCGARHAMRAHGLDSLASRAQSRGSLQPFDFQEVAMDSHFASASTASPSRFSKVCGR